MEKIITLLSIVVLYSCKSNTEHSNVNDSDKHHHYGQANHHMHKSSFEDLVNNFEADDRDEWQKPQEVIKFLGDLKNKTIIDIGAGTGYFEFKITEPSTKIIAADADDRFIKYLDERILKEKSINIVSRKAEYETPPVNQNEADIVYMIDVYHLLKTERNILWLLKRD
jgi:ubiquinone/menaquinone biosynthesis C-methylase UbiE